MPHAFLDTGAQTGTVDIPYGGLVPGIDPGGSQLGQPLKPALLLKDIVAVPRGIHTDGVPENHVATLYLKLSQELDLTPGLILPIYVVDIDIHQETAVGEYAVPATAVSDVGHLLRGKIFVPKVVGLRIDVVGGWSHLRWEVHVEYERVLIPFMDWFIGWDFLDNVVDNARDY